MLNKQTKSIEKWNKKAPYLFILPAAFILLAFMFYPLFSVFRYSFMEYRLSNLSNVKFIGFKNYAKLLKDPVILRSLKISAKWVITEVGLQLVFGMILALMLEKKFFMKGIYRVIVFFPWALSGVLTAVLWSLIYHETTGLLNAMLKPMGLITKNVAWLGNPKLVFIMTSIPEFWKGLPFFAITLLAALQNIPEDLHEACVIDGCNVFQEIFRIKIPMIKDTIILTTLLRVVWEFNSVDSIFALTGGGPAGMTQTLSIYLTDTAINLGDYGYGSTIGVLVFFILLLFAILYLKLSHFGQED